jgi:hypothetical protein
MKRITFDDLKMMDAEIPESMSITTKDMDMLHLLPEWEKIKNAYIIGFVNGCMYKDQRKKES